ncbi:very short patch repair endonuclease [Massilia litorea]|uniref:Very short patch repair endonuclease n=1 Tax=Massilia litorea TaxID=2769491 RepID=A0A7L9U595_9BURK|nr:very short patch repair endonuclease [Massilia litorea]QOL50243.1 DNA mismatch endonuclease Vsr [Massilia litorea]
MVDTLTAAERSHRMSLIRSRNTGPELALRRALHAKGLRYRIHFRGLPGKPDIVFTRRRVVVFVNGCFWHGHKCPTGHIPKSNSAFWKNKVETNRKRDARNIRALRAAGWKVIVVWECGLRNRLAIGATAASVAGRIVTRGWPSPKY